MQRWTSKPLRFHHDPRAPIKGAALELIGVDQRVPSFTANVYLNNPKVPEDAGTEGRGYAATFAFFGHGEDCWGDEGHCELPDAVSPFDQRAESTFQPANVTVPITDALTQLAQDEQVRVTILAWPVGTNGSSDEPLRFDELMLVTYS
ncbi:MAG TPA: hypothetical protein VFJ61_10885 [Solirubrobacterales bacterium]|nr:hypothetical protein [Solirubrobacterales bacterium]